LMRIVFFGSDDFAATSLKEILSSSHQVVGAITGPDTRQGRGMKMSLSPIKAIASEQDILCLQPESLKEHSIVEKLKSFNADIFVVVAYGRILPSMVLDIPKMFCINVHGSLLPQYRGAAPINWAIINGEKETGVTIQKMVFELDAGDSISQEKITIAEDTDAVVLREKMAKLGAELLVRTIDQIALGKYTFHPQDKNKISHAPKLTKEMGRIDWSRSAKDIERLIRGLKPWPGTFTLYKGKVLKILEASMVDVKGKPGTVISIGKEGFVIACGQEGLLIKQVHLEASKAGSAYDFIQGHRLAIGEQFI